MMPKKNVRKNVQSVDPKIANMPPMTEYGLLSWQDGTVMTGAIAIPYVRRDTAEEGLATFKRLLEIAEAPSIKRPYSEILPQDRRFEIVETAGGHVLVLAFSQEIEPNKGILTLMRHPQRRLVDMWFHRDLDFLIGMGG